jgi:hypothetical protein
MQYFISKHKFTMWTPKSSNRTLYRGAVTVVALLALMLLSVASASAQATWKPQFPSAGVETSEAGLSDVSCTSAEACWAVGHYRDDTKQDATIPLSEHWNGTKWTPQQTAPLPKGSTSGGGSSVSCPASEACMMTGTYRIDGSSTFVFPLAESWNGSKWTLLFVPVPEGAVYTALEGVSCTSATSCVAVGTYSTKNPSEGLPYVVRWNGTTWTAQTVSLPGEASKGRLEDISCTASNACTAVGAYTGGVLAEMWNGSSWSASEIENNGDASGISCTSAESCLAVGNIGKTAWIRSGTKWSPIQSPVEAAAEEGVEMQWAELLGVSCSSAQSCTAVGQYITFASWPLENLFITNWNGESWQLQTAIEPSEIQNNELSGVSCTDTDSCTAVGQSNYQAVAEHSTP